MSFKDKIVLITGGSSGIGADAAIHLSKLGASVAIVGRNGTKLQGVAQQIIAAGSPVPLEIVADVNVDAEKIINATIEKFGKLDVLVNNAGIIEYGTVETCSLESFDRIMNTNVRSVFQLTQLAIPHLEKTKGNIVNISSLFGIRSFTNILAYCISKSALDQFTKCVALELAPKGIRVNAVNPGAIVTPIFKTMGFDEKALQGYVENAKTSYPIGRIGEVEDTSAAIAFLAGESASFITGHLLSVDGGKSAQCPR